MSQTGTRDGHKAVDGVMKDAPVLNNLEFSALNDSGLTLTFTVPRIGKIVGIEVYDDGVGASATNFKVQVFDRDPNQTVDPGVVGENDVWSVNIGGLCGSAEWILSRSNINRYYRNQDDIVQDIKKDKLYVVLTTTGSTVDYAGRVVLDTVECAE